MLIPTLLRIRDNYNLFEKLHNILRSGLHHTCQVSRILRDPPGTQANLQHNSRPLATRPGFSLPGCSSKKQLEMCQNFTNMRSSVAEFSYFKFSEYIVID